MSEQKLIYQQIPKVMAEINAIAKGNRNQAQGYNFRGIDDVYNELHPLLAKHKIFSTTNILDQERSERQSAKGGVLMCSILTIKFTFFAEDGSFVEVSTVGEGMDSGDKASNKAMAVAHKYALMQLFSIPTDDAKDPENDSPEPAQRQIQRPPMADKIKESFPTSKTVGYVCQFGKYKGKDLAKEKPEELASYVKFLKDSAAEQGKPLSKPIQDFIAAVQSLDGSFPPF